jgi:hypothetical protein
MPDGNLVDGRVFWIAHNLMVLSLTGGSATSAAVEDVTSSSSLIRITTTSIASEVRANQLTRTLVLADADQGSADLVACVGRALSLDVCDGSPVEILQVFAVSVSLRKALNIQINPRSCQSFGASGPFSPSALRGPPTRLRH